MFSATFSDDVQRLAANYLKDYVFIAAGVVGGACKDVEQVFYEVSRSILQVYNVIFAYLVFGNSLIYAIICNT